MVILCMLHLKNSNHTFVKAAISLILSLCALTVKGALVSYHTLTEDDGLPTNAVLSVFKDHSGFMWIGTEKGLPDSTATISSRIHRHRAMKYGRLKRWTTIPSFMEL